jgi:glucosamine 6-phosphate synthetase-like amidotransferase/phosphosugar isomerase protein
MDNIRTAMNRGAFDFLCKPVNFDDLEVTMKKTIHHVQQLRQTLEAIKENNILRMYVDETVLNFMNRREFESSLMVNETIEIPAVHDALVPLLSVIPLQLFAYHTALHLGCNVDRPRNLAKSVTVE